MSCGLSFFTHVVDSWRFLFSPRLASPRPDRAQEKHMPGSLLSSPTQPNQSHNCAFVSGAAPVIKKREALERSTERRNGFWMVKYSFLSFIQVESNLYDCQRQYVLYNKSCLVRSLVSRVPIRNRKVLLG